MIKLTPCHVGSPAIKIGGEMFEVIWPPAGLSDQLGKGLNNTISEAGKLAKDLAEAGYPQLRDRLNAAYDTASERLPIAEEPQSDEQTDIGDLDSLFDDMLEEEEEEEC